MIRILFIFSIFLTLQTTLLAQKNRLGGIMFTYYPEAEVKDDLPEKPEVTFRETRFFFSVPRIYNDTATVILNNLDYTLTNTLINGQTDDRSDLHRLSYSFILAQRLHNDWTVSTVLTPTLATGFDKGMEGDDFIMQAAVSFIKKKSETFTYGIGLSVNTRFGEPLLVPVIQLKKEFKKSELNAIFPAFVHYMYSMGRFSAGAALNINGGQYNIDRPTGNNPDVHFEQADYSRVTLGPKFSYRLNSFFVVDLTVGGVFNRTFKLTDDRNSRTDLSLRNGTFFQTGIYFVPQRKK